MKSIFSFLSLTTFLLIASCNSSTETTTTTTTPAATARPAEKSPEPAAKKESTNSTELGISDDGVTYKRKSGDNETDVKLNEDSKTVIIKK